MRLHAAFAALAAIGVLGACAVPPEHPPQQPVMVEQVQPAAYQSQPLAFRVVDDGSTYMQQLFERSPADLPPDMAAAVDAWTVDGVDRHQTYIIAKSADSVREFIARDPARAVPAGDELVFGQDGARVRAYLVENHDAIDARGVAHASAGRGADGEQRVAIEFTSAGATQFGDLTARIVGHKLAMISDGVVISAPVIRDAITHGRAEVTFGPDDRAVALANSINAASSASSVH